MRVHLRYEQPNEKGLSRRERAERFGKSAPNFDLPYEFSYLWIWYWTISARLLRVENDVCRPIPPTEFLAWCQASGTIVSDVEYAILSAMDDVFCQEMNDEITDRRIREENERKKK